jgi:hypothetical protein
VEPVDEHRIAGWFWVTQRLIVEWLDAELGGQNRNDHSAKSARQEKERVERLVNHSTSFVLNDA